MANGLDGLCELFPLSIVDLVSDWGKDILIRLKDEFRKDPSCGKHRVEVRFM
ncbi:hypothetical protein PIB30_109936, partial [Stylosanthes scabra]|nr:hypothetical protein [Stylosanthes scabra]